MNPLINPAVCILLAAPAIAGTLAERLIASYEPVQSVSCEVRRDTQAEGGASVRTLSRVYFRRPDRLHVENTLPLKRRIVADGTNFFSFIEGDPKGFSRPIDKLNEEMRIQLWKVPGTALDHLMKLKGATETELSATNGFAERKGYATDKMFVVLSTDGTGRLARIEFFTGSDRKEQKAQYDYTAFQQMGGVWIPCLHEGWLKTAGVLSKDTTRISNLSVNTPIPDPLFVAGPFFKDVVFEEDFGKIYE